MTRLIDADKLKKCAIPCEIHNGALTDLCVPLYQVDNAPTVETPIIYEFKGCDNCELERTKGEWIAIKLPITEEEGDIKIICSNCKDEFIGQNDLETWIKVYHYCPNCGADMRGKKE